MAELGRPTKFKQGTADAICAELAKGRTLRDVCRDEKMPAESTVRTWALDDQGGFSAQYARAREIGYHAMADETLEIADNASNDWMELNSEDDIGWRANGDHIARSRLRVDTRKWPLYKALPKIYGDKVTVGGDPENPIKTEEVGQGASKLAAILDAIASRTTSSPAAE